MAMQFNYLSDAGAIIYNDRLGVFQADIEKFKAGARKLTGEIMTLQARGDYEGAKSLLANYAVIRPQMQRTLERMAQLPVDIEPLFTPPGE